MTTRSGFAALTLALAIGVGIARGDDATLDVAGAVATPLHLSAADLKALPPASVVVTFHTGHGDEKGSFAGVSLWSLLQKAGLADHEGNRTDLRHAIAVTGSDGYTVIVAFGEIDPDFEGKQIIVATTRDGKPLDAPRLIVPGDAHGGRDVRAVVRIEVR